MSSRLTLAIALAIASSTGFAASNAKDQPTQASANVLAGNPFATESTLPYQYPPFDKVKNEDYAPAFEEGMRQDRADINAIANNPEPATFENTLLALEKSGALLDRVSTVFYSLAGTNTNDTMIKLQGELAPKLSAHRDGTVLNGKLFARISSLYDQRDKLGLDAEGVRLVERYYKDFVRAGAKLSDADKEKLKAMNGEIATLQTQFAKNVLKEVGNSAIVVDDRKLLDGMSDDAIAAAAQTAKDKKMDGKYVIALQNTSGQPALSSLKDRDLRTRIMDTSLARNSHGGEFDNREAVSKITRLRAERAVLLGYPNHAAYALEDATAKTPEAVNKLLEQLAPPAVANARKEGAEIQKMIDAQKGGFQLTAADWSFYSDQVRKAKYDLDQSELRPYFEMDNVLQKGVFYAATKLYGITFKERTDLPKYHPDTRVFEVFNADGSHLALFIVDWYARSNKRGGAWMNAYVRQNELLGTTPIVANHLNIPKPPDGQPTLLTFDETNTAFHEFGHALHGMFSHVKYPRFSGTSVPRDFVEYPSQVNEMWATWPSILENYAIHYKTGERIPQKLVDKVLAAEQFNQGFATTEYLGSAMLDQAYHQIPASKAPSADQVLAFEAAALKKAGLDYAPVPPRYRSTYFSHTFAGGYSAGYYAYIWSEVLDADSVKWFKEHGGLTRANGDHFRKTLLSKGGSVDAMQLFRDFSGGDPDVQPLLIRRGLTTTPSAATTPEAK